MQKTERIRPPRIEMPGCNICSRQLKVTGESIVREFRRQEIRRQARDDKPTATFQPYRAIPQPYPSFIRRFIGRINWGRAFDLACGALAAIAIAYIFGFIFFRR